MRKALNIFGILTTIGMFFVLNAGTLVTNTGSANGCGHSWPLCHGEFRPIASLESLIEYSHRAITGIVGVMVIILSIWAWRALRGNKEIKWLIFFSLFFTFLQAGLGAAAVIWQQSGAVLALHFGFSLLGFASVLLLAIATFEKAENGLKSAISRSYLVYVCSLFFYIYGIVYLGAYVRRIDAGLAIHTWPLNNGHLIPPNLFSSVGVVFAHRFGALLAFFLVVWLFIWTKRRYAAHKDLSLGAFWMITTLFLQILSGGYVVLSKLSVEALMVHGAIISLFFGALCFLCWRALQKPTQKHLIEETVNDTI